MKVIFLVVGQVTIQKLGALDVLLGALGREPESQHLELPLINPSLRKYERALFISSLKFIA